MAGRQVLLLCRKRASAELAVGAHDGDGRLHLAFAVPAADLSAWEAWLEQHSVAIEERRGWGSGGEMSCTNLSAFAGGRAADWPQ